MNCEIVISVTLLNLVPRYHALLRTEINFLSRSFDGPTNVSKLVRLRYPPRGCSRLSFKLSLAPGFCLLLILPVLSTYRPDYLPLGLRGCFYSRPSSFAYCRFFAGVGDQILSNLRLELKAKLFYKQRIPDNPWWKNCSTSQLVNKLSY